MGVDNTTAHIQTILRFALALRDATGISHQPSDTPFHSSRAVIDSISLPSPPALLPFLLEAGASHEIAEAVSKVYQLRSDELRRHIQESIVTACRKIAELPTVAPASSQDLYIRNVVSSFTEVYLRRLEQWKEDVIRRIKQASKLPSNAVPKNSRTFNHEYVPLLEHFFEENPFPTHADKMFLAKKSNMEYRQIHVWFQNRRNRTRKEGKSLRKKLTHEGAMKPLDKLYERMNGHMVDPEPPKPTKVGPFEGTVEVIEIAQNNMSKDVLASFPPPHAFPSSYPPTCHYDPFPCKTGPISFSKPEWRRVPDGKHIPSLPVGIDDLIERFSHLSVRDGACSKPRLRSHAATVAITVIPSRAPHPALIVHKYFQPTSIQLCPSIRAPAPCPRAFQSPSPTSKPVTLVPPSVPPNKSRPPGKRKTVPLPQRFGRARNTRRDTTPSESSSISPSSPRLFTTDFASATYSLSSVSSQSTPLSIQELPPLLGSPCRSPSDSPIHLLGLGNMNMAAISSATPS